MIKIIQYSFLTSILHHVKILGMILMLSNSKQKQKVATLKENKFMFRNESFHISHIYPFKKEFSEIRFRYIEKENKI
ncbi:hypothetical protein BpHYR1_030974 [Brachionus plicatilis]|uniref:Uncharacterized protein n=1 Tax=Brachionus plicatilis TaxID=10195 RepID=A0A3M7SWJ2_BRAPC|nr:hypothetical protein BpHYR1_030974 [Brachionus plicatilis]